MRTARREFMRNVGIGSVAVVGSSALGATLAASGAGAQGRGGDPVALNPADQATLLFLESLELASAALFSQAINRHLMDAVEMHACRIFSDHQKAHGSAIAALVGGPTGASAPPNDALLAEMTPQIQAAGSAQALLELLATLGERLAATGQAAMEQLSSLVAASVVSRISPVDAQQAAALGDMAGRPAADWLPLTQPTAGAFQPSAYPA